MPTAPPRKGLLDRLAPLAGTLYWVLVAFIVIESQREAWMDFDGPADARARVAVLAAIGTATLLFCRRLPLLSMLTASVVVLLLTSDDARTVVYFPTFAVAICGYMLGRHGNDRELAIGVTVSAGFVLTSELLDAYASSVGNIFAILLLSILAPAGLGRAARERAVVHEALCERAAADAADRQLVAEQALLDERTRIAGELHDVVAHALSAMIVQAGGARMQIDRDQEKAAAAFSAVEQTGRDALFEIRSLLGVLRSSADADALEPQPSVEGLPLLISRVSAAGLPTELDVRGDARELTPGTSLAAYRVVQDALRAARDDGGATSARVIVDWTAPGDLRLRVRDDGATERPVLPARERVLLYGGDLRSGRGGRSGAEHELSVRLPTGVAS